MVLAEAGGLPYNAFFVATHGAAAASILFHLPRSIAHTMTLNRTPQGPDTRNLILALVLGTAIMAGWQFFYEQPKMAERKAYLEEQRLKQEAKKTLKAAEVHSDVDAVAEGAADTPQDRAALIAAAKAERIDVASSTLHGSISLVGGRIDDLTLAQYRETQKKDSPEVVLLSPSGSKANYFAEFGWLAAEDGMTMPTSKTRWQADGETLTPETPVTLSWNNNQGLAFTKKVSLDKDYLFTLATTVTNTSSKPVTLYPYGRIQRSYDESAAKHFAILHEGPLAVFNNTLTDVKYKELREDGPQKTEHTKGWLGFTDKYWLTAMVPDKGYSFDATMKIIPEPGVDGETQAANYQVDYRADAVTVEAGESITLTNHLFAGAKKVSVLDDYRDRLGFPLFDRAVDFGMLYFLTKPIFKLLDGLYGFVGNFGVAILILTVIIKGIMFPLANKSYAAMSRMKILMPKIKDIQERHKSDKLKMNTEIMELYKREKVNPVSGCLPILIQMPVFFALYKVLFVTIEMRHAPFFGWIKDLSAPDPTNLFTLFGLVEWPAPSFLHLGIWPIIMCATMVIQQRLNPKPTDEVQAAIMKWMPFMFLFLFAGFPAGLVVYWAWNNTLSIIQQRFIQWKLERKGTV